MNLYFSNIYLFQPDTFNFHPTNDIGIRHARKELRFQLGIWTELSGATIVAFIVLLYFLLTADLNTTTLSQSIYISTLRILAFAFTGSLAAYCLSIFKSQLHQYQYNLHRQKLANSIGAFLGAARTQEQQNTVFNQLLNAIVNYGDFGSLKHLHQGADSGSTNIVFDGMQKLFKNQPENPPNVS